MTPATCPGIACGFEYERFMKFHERVPIRTKSDLIVRLAVANSWDTTQEQQTRAIAVIQSHTVL